MDPRGKVVVITGATSGLGQAFAIDLAKAGARVFIVGRDAARAEETRSLAGGGEVVTGDVSTRAGVKAVAAAILAKTNTVDVLVNNAGGSMKTESRTADGLETTFAVNTFGPWLLERELHRALAGAKGRVVNVATGFLDSFPVDPDDLATPKRFSSMKQYGRAKQAAVMMTVEQAKRYSAEGVTVVSLHPGIIMGTRFGGGQPKAVQLIMGPVLRGIGFATTLDEATRRFRVACFDDVPSGAYIVNGKPAPLPKQVNDAGVRQRVVTLLEKLAA
jgi:NAD(P)-dependent dehydrogenase (short-subunit alcohol dehydrogenase family)